MANSDLYGDNWNIPNDIISSINKELHKNKDNKSLKGYKRAKNLTDTRSISYSMLKRLKNFFVSFSGSKTDPEYLINGGDKMKTWINGTLDKSRGSIKRQKTLKSDSGMKNQFKKTHTKDKENKNITKVNLARPLSGSRELKTNKGVYTEMIRIINRLIK
jgi:hypothetical protein|tara:strand:- start:1178 stop:1657 length:480 start_codon:yes stop_codon:yes gene_type:complete